MLKIIGIIILFGLFSIIYLLLSQIPIFVSTQKERINSDFPKKIIHP